MRISTAFVTLFLIFDPLGNVPPFLAVLKRVAPERRRLVLIRETLVAYAILLAFFFLGTFLLELLHLRQESISVSGGIILFIIAIRMIFPVEGGIAGETPEGEPFVVPLAIPLFAGPSALAALLLLQESNAGSGLELWVALTLAWAASAVILIFSTTLYRVLGQRGLIALERLMGMLLVMVAVQMFLDGVARYLRP
jgi:multiple antibiotic resistance protein